MYFKTECIISSLTELSSLHPFYGITYLACKSNNLPVGKAVEFHINSAETQFLAQYYKPIPDTEKFFRVFRKSERNKFWLNNDYASSGSQATRTQMFADVFIHPKNSNMWGWENNYINALNVHLNKKKIPAYSLALWILKEEDWSNIISIGEILILFFKKFNISDKEIELLFDISEPVWLLNDNLYSHQVYNWNTISNAFDIPLPLDVPIEKGGALLALTLKNIDPYYKFNMDLSDRMNIITGDNGLGKSFVLECAWWALTGSWTKFPIYPKNLNNQSSPQISFKLAAARGRNESIISNFNWKSQKWELDKINKKTIPGLVIYAQVDGAFAIWDPARISVDAVPITYIFSREDVWEGLRVGDGNRLRSIFNGLITDWVHWQNSQNEAFDILKKVLKRLSPPDLSHGDLGELEPGEIVRIPGESRPIPTIKHSYGEVPIVFASAAVKRILALAYLIVWTWEEHKTSANLMREEPQSKMVVIADEIESHLHPQWQRVILPALTSISNDLSKNLDIQYIITTHSPLVMASIEPIFNEETDNIFHLNLQQKKDIKANVILDSVKFQKRGSADSWLVSDIFDLKQPRSIDAERAIEQAVEIQKNNTPSKEEILSISQNLLELLPSHDKFWIRWNFFAEKHGVEL